MTTLTSSIEPSYQSPPSALAPIDSGAALARVPILMVFFQTVPSTDITAVVACFSQVIVWYLPSARSGPVVFCHESLEPLRWQRASDFPLTLTISIFQSPPFVDVRPFRMRS